MESIMPITMTSHPVFRVHDRHPLLHGLPVILLCLAFIIAFISSVMPAALELLSSPGQTEQDAGR
jgi:hypothetical protein